MVMSPPQPATVKLVPDCGVPDRQELARRSLVLPKQFADRRNPDGRRERVQRYSTPVPATAPRLLV